MFKPYLSAAFAAIAVETFEEERLLEHLKEEFEGDIYVISASKRLIDGRNQNMDNHVIDPQFDFGKAFATVAAAQSGTILIVHDFQHLIRSANAYRALKDQFPRLKSKGNMVILVAPSWKMPEELIHDIPVLQWALPTRSELNAALDVIVEAVESKGFQSGLSDESRSACLDAAAGLTLQEAENAFALSVSATGALDDNRIEEEKIRLIRTSGHFEVWPEVSLSSIGGLKELKEYMQNEVVASWQDPQLRVRGLLFAGPPGTGKSQTAKTAGGMLSCPIVRMDVSKLKGSRVGESENNMVSALKLVDAIAPAVLFIDEVEKGIGGYASSAQSDSGTLLGMVGLLLTWLQEHTTPVLTICTCNDFSKLPPEFCRAGRFDERFYVDLPHEGERREIAEIHLEKYGCPKEFAEVIASISKDWSGAEIEQLIKSAARRSARSLDEKIIYQCSKEIKPLALIDPDATQRFREWGRKTMRLANSPERVDKPARNRRNVGLLVQ